MSRVEMRLRALEYVFVTWYVVQAVLGTWIAFRVLEGLQRTHLSVVLPGPTMGVVVASSVVAEAALLALGIVLFQFVLRLDCVARVVLLVLAWISAASAMIGLVAAPVVPSAARALSGVSVLSNLLSLAFWVWTIKVLQFDEQVRRAFAGGAR